MAGEDTSVSGAAGRYATALFELAREQNAIEAVQRDLDQFNRMIDESPDLARLVRSPVFTAEEQSKAVTALLTRAGIGGLTGNFIRLVAQNRRLFALPAMVRDFAARAARHRGEVTAQVTVAEPLGAAHLETLKTALAGVSGKHVSLDVKIDPTIIGGLVVKLGSRMIDTSLRTKLNAIKVAMKEAR